MLNYQVPRYFQNCLLSLSMAINEENTVKDLRLILRVVYTPFL